MVTEQGNTKDLTEKFTALQDGVQKLKEDKIRLESELKTLRVEYDNNLQELLTLTGATTVQGAIKVYKERSAALETEKETLESELDKYLLTLSDAPEEE